MKKKRSVGCNLGKNIGGASVRKKMRVF